MSLSPIKNIPIYYLIQIAGYLYLYDREWWDFMSCCFNENHELNRYRIIRIYRNQVRDIWKTTWYPQIINFVNSIAWNK